MYLLYTCEELLFCTTEAYADQYFSGKKMSNIQKNFWEGENMSLHLRKRVPISHLLAFTPEQGFPLAVFNMLAQYS